MLYDYKCKICEKVFEVSHGMNEKPEIKCPLCEGEARKTFSANGIIFKGSGWYVTDSSGKGELKETAETDSGKTDSS